MRRIASCFLLLCASCGPSAPPGPKVETKRSKVERGDIVLNVSSSRAPLRSSRD